MEELERLVNEYNQAEAEQQRRRQRLFALLRARRGYRIIRFGQDGPIWTNCWALPERIVIPKFVDPLDMTITDCSFGSS